MLQIIGIILFILGCLCFFLVVLKEHERVRIIVEFEGNPCMETIDRIINSIFHFIKWGIGLIICGVIFIVI